MKNFSGIDIFVFLYFFFSLYDTRKNSLSFWTLLRLIYLLFYLGNIVNSYFLDPPYFLDGISEKAIQIGNIIFIGSLLIMDVSTSFLKKNLKYSVSRFSYRKSMTNNYFVLGLLLFFAFEVVLFFNGVNLLDVKPNQLDEFYSFYSFLLLIIPFGLALRKREYFKYYFLDILILFLLSFFSHSRAQFVVYLFNYFLALFVLGDLKFITSHLIKYLFSIMLLCIISLGIRHQVRENKNITFSITALMQNTSDALAMRFLGGIYRSYLKSVETVVLEKYITLGGKYHKYILYCYIPRFLWKDKPNPAKDYTYYYLDFPKSKHTSWSLTHFGTLIIDFGIIGVLLGSLLFSILIVLFEFLLVVLEQSMLYLGKNIFLFLNYAFLTFTFSIAESGIIAFFTGIALLMFILLSFFLYKIQIKKWLKC